MGGEIFGRFDNIMRHPDIASVRFDALLGAMLTKFVDGSADVLPIAANSKQMLTHDTSGDSLDFCNFLLRFLIQEIKKDHLTLFLCQEFREEAVHGIGQIVHLIFPLIPIFAILYVFKPDA